MEGWVEGKIVKGSSGHVLCIGIFKATISQKPTVLRLCNAGQSVEDDTTIVGDDGRSSISWGGKMGAGEELGRSNAVGLGSCGGVIEVNSVRVAS